VTETHKCEGQHDCITTNYETTGVVDSSIVTAEKAMEMAMETSDKNVSCKVDVRSAAIQTKAHGSN